MRTWFIAVVVLFAAAALYAAGEPEYRTDRILVKPKSAIATPRIVAAHAALAARIHRQYPRFGGWQVIKLPRGLSVAKALDLYRRSGLFEKVQPDYIRHIVATPDDLYFTNGTLYGIVNIGCTNAWDVRSNADTIVVAMIDTGVNYDHEDLAGNIWSNPCVNCAVNGIVYSNDLHGINAITSTGDPMDDHGHGTHTAGTVGAVGNNGVGVCGVAWRVQLMPLKFIASNGTGDDADAIECINYAIAKGAHLMSNSWGGYGDSPALYDAIRSARNAGILFVAAAGNNNADSDTQPFIPAAFDLDNIVAVASTDSSDNRASDSNYGRETVDLGAPGVNIVSTWNSSTNAYATDSGTSMACPHVAGALALVKAEFPAETYTQLIHRVLGNVDPVAAMSNITVTGGRLNVFKALTQTPKPLANFAVDQQGGYTVTFTNLTMGAVTNIVWDFGDGSPTGTAFHLSHVYTNAGTYTVSLNVEGAGGSDNRARTVIVGNNYYVRPAPFDWIDPTGMTPLSLSDDSVSRAQTLPFAFVYYGQTNTTLYVGSNGLLGFNPNNLSSASHGKLPSASTPNSALCPYWTDLNPDAGGAVYVGTTGDAPNRVEVISWVGVPHFSDNSATLTFQVLLSESSNDIVFQYQEVSPTNTSSGAGNAATIGIENNAGTIARLIDFNGSHPITNNQALRFTLSPPAPLWTGLVPASPSTNLNLALSGTTVPLAQLQISTNGCGAAVSIPGTSDGSGAFTVNVTIDTNTTTIFNALAIDVAGNTSECSSAISYVYLDPAGDADGDGFTTLQELIAGTDPTNGASYPQITSLLLGESNSVAQIQSVAGRTYQLQSRDAMDTGDWSDVGTNWIGDGLLLSLSDLTGSPQRFYRVKISP
jgi:PKD repeat protein